jgi:hypothetical protein
MSLITIPIADTLYQFLRFRIPSAGLLGQIFRHFCSDFAIAAAA